MLDTMGIGQTPTSTMSSHVSVLVYRCVGPDDENILSCSVDR